MRRLAAVGAVAAALSLAGSALASDRVDLNATGVKLAVSKDGKTAVVTYRAKGKLRHALVWGAINALPPSETAPQVRFQIDWTGGWAAHRDASWWKRVGNACRRYDGPPLVQLVAACKAPDGSYWALQQWQPNLPHRGVDPWQAGQTDWELDVSHWTGPLAELEVHADWAFESAHDLFGRLTYQGVPVHGFHTTKAAGGTNGGAPADRYGRSLYIDTLDSAYGPGWKRDTSIVFRNPTGAFCYSFQPTNDASLPGKPARPPGKGSRYRIEVLGPGVTPNLVAEVDDPGEYDPNDAKKAAYERQMNQLLLKLAAGDKYCPTQL
jgi:hypothetical protein